MVLIWCNAMPLGAFFLCRALDAFECAVAAGCRSLGLVRGSNSCGEAVCPGRCEPSELLRLQLNTAVATPPLRHLTSDSLVGGFFKSQ